MLCSSAAAFAASSAGADGGMDVMLDNFPGDKGYVELFCVEKNGRMCHGLSFPCLSQMEDLASAVLDLPI